MTDDAPSLDDLLAALASDDEAERLEAHVRLLPLGDAVAVAVAGLLRSDKVAERREAAWLLAHLLGAAEPAKPMLDAALDDEDEDVRRWVGLALARIEDPEAAEREALEEIATFMEQLAEMDDGDETD